MAENLENIKKKEESNPYRRAQNKPKKRPGGAAASVVEQTAVEETPVVETPAAEVVVQPVVSQPVVDQPLVSRPVVEEPVVQQPVVTQPVVSQPVVMQEPAHKETVQPEVEKEIDTSTVLVDRYSAIRGDGESKSVRFSALIKPSLIKKMDADIRNKRIKSRNDLLNFLLEQYYGDSKK